MSYKEKAVVRTSKKIKGVDVDSFKLKTTIFGASDHSCLYGRRLFDLCKITYEDGNPLIESDIAVKQIMSL